MDSVTRSSTREDVRDRLMDIMEEVVVDKVTQFTDGDAEFSDWKLRPLADWVNLNFPLGMPEAEILKAAEAGQEKPVAGSLFDGLSQAQFAVCNFLSDSIRKAYDLKISFENPEALKEVERFTIFSAIDKLWQDHLIRDGQPAPQHRPAGARPARPAASNTRPKPSRFLTN